MRSRILKVVKGALPSRALTEAAKAVQRGGLVVFPTETVYGLGASAFATPGLQAIYRLKGRSWKKPLALLVESLDMAALLVDEIPAEARALARRFWPGPLTLLLKPSLLGRLVTGGLPAIGLRVPQHPAALALVRTAGVPIAATSANPSGKPPVVTGAAAYRLFNRKVDILIDGGTCPVGVASTVLDLTAAPFTVKREGVITKKDLEAFLQAHPPHLNPLPMLHYARH